MYYRVFHICPPARLPRAEACRTYTHKLIIDREGFEAQDFASEDKVLALFEPSHMEYELDRADDPAGEPSISEMTRAAITRLSQDPDGYVLLVEGGRIDHAHHAGNAAPTSCSLCESIIYCTTKCL